MRKHVIYSIGLLILSFTLLSYSISGQLFFTEIMFIDKTYARYSILTMFLLIIFALGYLFRKKLEAPRFFGNEEVSDLSKVFILKPVIENVSENELKNAMIELSSFIRFLHEKDIRFELSFVSTGSKKPFMIKLSVYSGSTNVHDFVKTNFKLFCRKWSLLDNSSHGRNNITGPFMENPFF